MWQLSQSVAAANYTYRTVYVFIYLEFYVAFNTVQVILPWVVGRNQYIQLVKVLYYKLLTNGKQLPAFPLKVGASTKPRSHRWEASVTTLPPWPLIV